jgi:hypothetical protein
MKKITLTFIGAGLLAGTLYADGHNMNYHIHEGKMMNHKHPDFYPDHSKVPGPGEPKRDPNYWENKSFMNAIYEVHLKQGIVK